MLDLLDKELESRGHKFVRYADDISIFTSSQRGAERILASLIDWIERRLKLKINREKSGIRRPSSGNLLGFGFWHGPESSRILRCWWSRLANGSLSKTWPELSPGARTLHHPADWPRQNTSQPRGE
jgi:hypothetical protein